MSWRDHLPTHPAAERFPLLLPHELRELGEDIKKNRLQERAKVMRQGDKFVLLDGRSRLDAIETVGMPIKVFEGDTPNRHLFEVVEVDDPIAFVISANIRRRHLSGEDKGRLIAELIKLDPTKSNRQIAKATDTSHPTVGKVRTKLEQAGDVVTVTTSVDTKGRKQPARKSKPKRRSSAKSVIPPIDEASLPARPAPQEFNDEADAKDQEVDLERELAIAKAQIGTLEDHLDEAQRLLAQKADEVRTLQAALKEKNASAVTPGSPVVLQMEVEFLRRENADLEATLDRARRAIYDEILTFVETFHGSAGAFNARFRSMRNGRNSLTMGQQTAVSRAYTAKFNQLLSQYE